MVKNKKNQNKSKSEKNDKVQDKTPKTIKGDKDMIDKVFKKIKNEPNFDWKNCTFGGLKDQLFVDSRVIMHLLSRINEDSCYTFEEMISKRLSVIYWHNRLVHLL